MRVGRRRRVRVMQLNEEDGRGTMVADVKSQDSSVCEACSDHPESVDDMHARVRRGWR